MLASALVVATTAVAVSIGLSQATLTCTDTTLRDCAYPAWRRPAIIARAALIAAAGPLLQLPYLAWFQLRIGLVGPRDCPRCGVHGAAVHSGCRGWMAKRPDLDADVARARRGLAWQSIRPRWMTTCIVLVVVGVATIAYGATIEPTNNLDTCLQPGPVGEVRSCSSKDTSARGPVMATGLVAVMAGLLSFSGAFLYRHVHPKSFDPGTLAAPPGGW